MVVVFGGRASLAQHRRQAGLTSSLQDVGMGQTAVCGGVLVVGVVSRVEVVSGGLASSAQHHQRDGPASSIGRVSMGTEQYAVVVSLLLLKLWLKSE